MADEQSMIVPEDIPAVGTVDGSVEAPQDGQNIIDGSAGAPPPEFTASNYKMNYKGQEVYPKDHAHLINLAQQGYGYSQSMEALNKQKVDLENQQTTYSKYADLDKRLQEDPELNTRFWNNLNNTSQDQSDEITPEMTKIRELEGKLRDYDGKFKHYEASQADEALKAEATALMKKYPTHDWTTDRGEGDLLKRVKQHAYDNYAPNLEMAYRNYVWDSQVVNNRAASLKQAQDNRIADKKAGIIQQGGGKAPPASKKTGYTGKEGYNDLAEAAVKELGG